MKKRVSALFLCAVLLLSLCGCGEKPPETVPGPLQRWAESAQSFCDSVQSLYSDRNVFLLCDALANGQYCYSLMYEFEGCAPDYSSYTLLADPAAGSLRLNACETEWTEELAGIFSCLTASCSGFPLEQSAEELELSFAQSGLEPVLEKYSDLLEDEPLHQLSADRMSASGLNFTLGFDCAEELPIKQIFLLVEPQQPEHVLPYSFVPGERILPQNAPYPLMQEENHSGSENMLMFKELFMPGFNLQFYTSNLLSSANYQIRTQLRPEDSTDSSVMYRLYATFDEPDSTDFPSNVYMGFFEIEDAASIMVYTEGGDDNAYTIFFRAAAHILETLGLNHSGDFPLEPDDCLDYIYNQFDAALSGDEIEAGGVKLNSLPDTLDDCSLMFMTNGSFCELSISMSSERCADYFD